MKDFDKLVKIIRILRSPGGCPWDRAQTIENYKKFILEETYELIDEISQNKSESIKEELGDLFLILVIITEMFKDKGHFNLQDVLNGASKKLIYRHPHVFSSKKLKTDKEVLAYWIKHKAKHKKRKTIEDRLPKLAPSLLLADIFFKEYTHIDKKKHGTKEVFEHIRNNLSFLAAGKNKKVLFREIIFSIAHLASLYQIDLENILRKKVIKEAKKAHY